jgi:hypothetical protein
MGESSGELAEVCVNVDGEREKVARVLVRSRGSG